jgi:hypothetical protein
LKGPRPKGLKRFKKVEQTEPQVPEEELSENQKRKLEKAKRKQEDLALKAIEDEKQRKLQEE